jgi:hypothetical protein
MPGEHMSMQGNAIMMQIHNLAFPLPIATPRGIRLDMWMICVIEDAATVGELALTFPFQKGRHFKMINLLRLVAMSSHNLPDNIRMWQSLTTGGREKVFRRGLNWETSTAVFGAFYEGRRGSSFGRYCYYYAYVDPIIPSLIVASKFKM